MTFGFTWMRLMGRVIDAYPWARAPMTLARAVVRMGAVSVLRNRLLAMEVDLEIMRGAWRANGWRTRKEAMASSEDPKDRRGSGLRLESDCCEGLHVLFV